MVAKKTRKNNAAPKAKKAKTRKAASGISGSRFPNETLSYRKARDRLLKAEIVLRRQVEEVAKLRRKLPAGGVIAEDFEFDEVSIANYIANNTSYDIGAYAETSELTSMAVTAINSLGGGGVPVLMKVSNDGLTYVDFLNPSTLGSQFTLSSANITINIVA